MATIVINNLKSNNTQSSNQNYLHDLTESMEISQIFGGYDPYTTATPNPFVKWTYLGDDIWIGEEIY